MVDIAEIEAWDGELARLAHGEARVRLRIGEALDALFGKQGHHDLGFSTQAAYARERLSRSGRWAAESRLVAARLAELSLVRAALVEGRIGWSMAELLAREATKEDEATLVVMAGSRTVRAMREVVAQRGERSILEKDPGERWRTLSVTVTEEEAWQLQVTRTLIEHIDGGSSDWVSSFLAEAVCTMSHLVTPSEELFPSDVVVAQARWQRRQAEAEARREREEASCEEEILVEREPIFGPGSGWEEEPLPDTARGLDRHLRALCGQLDSRDVWLGKLLSKFWARRGWEALGYASAGQYARERLGMSRAAVWSRITFARRTQGLGPLAAAVQDGRIGSAAAELVARVATAENVEAWIDRAEERTYKLVHEEVQAVEMALRILGPDRVDTAPPSDEDVEDFRKMQSEVLSGESYRETVQGLARPVDARRQDAEAELDRDAVQMSAARMSAVQMSAALTRETARSRLGKTTVRLRVREEDLLLWRQLEETYRRLGIEGGFVRFLCLTFWMTWEPHLGKSDKWEQTYRRFCYRCSSPVCFRRDVTLHHPDVPLARRRRQRGEPHDALCVVPPRGRAWGPAEGDAAGLERDLAVRSAARARGSRAGAARARELRPSRGRQPARRPGGGCASVTTDRRNRYACGRAPRRDAAAENEGVWRQGVPTSPDALFMKVLPLL